MIELDIMNMTLELSSGSYEIRYLDNDGKIIEKEIIDSSPYVLNSLVKNTVNGKEVNPLVSSNPVSDKELWNEDSFTKDEKRIKEVKRIVLDIDYSHDEYAFNIMRLLMDRFSVEHNQMINYISATKKIHLYIPVNQEGLSTVEAIKICKVFLHKFNNELKGSLGISLDNTFLHNFGHYIFVEEFFLPIKDNRKSALVMPDEIRDDNISEFPLLMWKSFLNEYDKLFKEKKRKSKKVSNGGSSKRKSYEVLSNEQKEKIENEINLINNQKDFTAKIIDRKKKIRYSNTGRFFKYLSDVVGSEISDIPLSEIQKSKLYNDFYEKEQNHFIAYARWIMEGLSYFRTKLYKLAYYDTTYADKKTGEIKDKKEYRFQRVVFPTIQTLVDIFGIDYVRKSKLPNIVLDIIYAHNDEIKKENLIEDIEIAFQYVDENEKRKEVDKDYPLNKQKENTFYKVLKLLTDITSNNIDSFNGNAIVIKKKELKEKYKFTRTTFALFMQVLREYNKAGVVEFSEKTRELHIERICNPYYLLREEIKARQRLQLLAGRFKIRILPIINNNEKYFFQNIETQIPVSDKPLENVVLKHLHIELAKRRKKVDLYKVRKLFNYIVKFNDSYIESILKFSEFEEAEKHRFAKLLLNKQFFIKFINEFIEELLDAYEGVERQENLIIAFSFSSINRNIQGFINSYLCSQGIDNPLLINKATYKIRDKGASELLQLNSS